MRANLAPVLTGLSALLLSACTSPVDGSAPISGAPFSGPVALRVLQTYSHCPVRAESEHLAVFTDAADWSRHLSALSGAAGRAQPALPANLDWQRESVVLVGIGPRRSAGYSLELASPAQVQAGELRLQMTVREPAPGSFQAMSLTQPCSYYLVASQAFDRASLKGLVAKRRAP